VQIWTNLGTRGCSNPTEARTPLPSIYVLLSYILPKDGVNVYANDREVVAIIHSILYSSSADLDKYWNQRLQQPIYYVLPSYILPKDGVNVYVNFSMSGKLWLLHSTFLQF
jgi:hypothetical protein